MQQPQFGTYGLDQASGASPDHAGPVPTLPRSPRCYRRSRHSAVSPQSPGTEAPTPSESLAQKPEPAGPGRILPEKESNMHQGRGVSPARRGVRREHVFRSARWDIHCATRARVPKRRQNAPLGRDKRFCRTFNGSSRKRGSPEGIEPRKCRAPASGLWMGESNRRSEPRKSAEGSGHNVRKWLKYKL